MKKLLIVESPSKAKKIGAMLGTDWIVKASVGHFRDLPDDRLAIDKTNKFEMEFVIAPEKSSIVKELKKAANEVGKENIYLATDPDREGEAISFHLAYTLGINLDKLVRVTYADLSESTIRKALENPRKIDIQLVYAQQARRAIDRLVGYQISNVLSNKLNTKGLSAGRVQTVGLKLIVEREKTIHDFKTNSYFNLSGIFNTINNEAIKATGKIRFENTKLANDFLASMTSNTFSVSDLVIEPVERKPVEPFSTSTLQQVANKKLDLDIKKIMEVAQSLYENGHITYMRTDSVNLSPEAMHECKNQVIAKYGDKYFKARSFINKSESAQEAHEAIRPTHFENSTITGTEQEQELYKLIYNRTIASQMASALFEKTSISILGVPSNEKFITTANVLKFDGYLIAFNDSDNEDDLENENTPIKSIALNEIITGIEISSKQTFTKPPKRYGQADLVKDLEHKEIGRPSTYATIPSTLLRREYIDEKDNSGAKIKGVKLTINFLTKKIIETEFTENISGDKKKLTPTPKGIKVCDFVEDNFKEIIDYKFTSIIEKSFDLITSGKTTYLNSVSIVNEKLDNYLAETSKIESTGEPKERKTSDIGSYLDKPMSVGTGKFGTYILHNSKFYNVKDKLPNEISEEIAISIIKEALNNPTNKSDSKSSSSTSSDKLLHKVGPYTIVQNDKGTFITYKTDRFYANKFWTSFTDKTEADCKKQHDWFLANIKNKK